MFVTHFQEVSVGAEAVSVAVEVAVEVVVIAAVAVEAFVEVVVAATAEASEEVVVGVAEIVGVLKIVASGAEEVEEVAVEAVVVEAVEVVEEEQEVSRGAKKSSSSLIATPVYLLVAVKKMYLLRRILCQVNRSTTRNAFRSKMAMRKSSIACGILFVLSWLPRFWVALTKSTCRQDRRFCIWELPQVRQYRMLLML